MSKIVLELQRDAVESNSDVVSLLRKAYLVARKLKLKEFESWINNELNGYEHNKVPNYRIFKGRLKGRNILKSWEEITVPSKYEKLINNYEMRQPIFTVVNMCNNKKINSTKISLPSKLNKIFLDFFDDETEFAISISNNQLYAVIEKVKNIILDWTINLEENGILGENLEFSNFERECAQKNPIIYNYTNNFYGNVNNTQIQQDAKKSIQS
ncbi:hypothetical protein [Megamonas hypermegale]|uniref:AbiTii domain-containing protein n=1 Tax=Megamonas hypermegale TaxID=158847 RepID=UPI00195B3B79|nr:hypothetical protein [Megamonas hypermegale]MBM6760050.1 hypothetical protein [Megamonas hypermegale]